MGNAVYETTYFESPSQGVDDLVGANVVVDENVLAML